jgi:hypothetical protein
MPSIEVLHITLAEVAHQTGARIGRGRSHEEMDMVCHQAVRVHRAVVSFRQLAQVREVDEIVVVTAEASSSVVAALDDMDGYAGQDQSQGSRHSS